MGPNMAAVVSLISVLEEFQMRLDYQKKPVVETLEARRMLAAHVLGSTTLYPTIQAAVNAAPVGGTVRVDPGTYNELVTVNKQLTVIGSRSGRSIVDGAALSGGGHSTSFDITANDVTIESFAVQGNTSSGNLGAGIVIAPKVSGTYLYYNVIQNNVAGLFLANASSTDPAVIRYNIFANNNNPGTNSGRGIYSDGGVSGGTLTNVLIDGNLFVGNVGSGASGSPEAAIGLEAQTTASTQSNITITHNLMRGNGKGVLVFDASNITIANNLITGSTDSTSAAIRDEGHVNGMKIIGNTIIANKGAGISLVNIFNGPSSNITVNYNNIAFNAVGGLFVSPTAYTGTLDARNNWWGSFDGPSGLGSGHGNSIIANGNTILFNPFSRFPIFWF